MLSKSWKMTNFDWKTIIFNLSACCQFKDFKGYFPFKFLVSNTIYNYETKKIDAVCAESLFFYSSICHSLKGSESNFIQPNNKM